MRATVELHQELGPLATTISAIAERAKVERLTVYRHFPDQPSLHAACTQHFFALNPPPSLSEWAAITDPRARLAHALEELYSYWERGEPMFSSLLADHQHDPDRAGGGVAALIGQAQKTLLKGWPVDRSNRRALRAAVGHAVHFYTWHTLAHQQGLTSRTAAKMMTAFVDAIADTTHAG